MAQPDEGRPPQADEIEEGDGDTSVDSMMEDTPANYNIPNQRFDENYDDYDPIPEEQETKQRPARRQRPT